MALTNIKTLALATGDGLVAAEVFDANTLSFDTQIDNVQNWLNDLSDVCDSPVPAVLVGHSLGGDGAIKVQYDNICSRILLDPFDWDYFSLVTRFPLQHRAPARKAPRDGFVYSYLAEFANVFQGRPLKNEPNVEQRCVRGSDHNSIVEAVVSSGAFQDSIVGRELSRCAAGTAAPTPPQFYERCHNPVITSILNLLLRD